MENYLTPGTTSSCSKAFLTSDLEPGKTIYFPVVQEVTSLAARYRLPAVYGLRLFAEVGGLLSYGEDLTDNFRRAATYADRILKGEKPSDLPGPWTPFFDWKIIPIMDIGAWLRSLGLERYETIFRENAIDADLLHDLTEDHLREMGLPLGARLKLRKAISALVPRPELISPAPPVAPSGPPADTADRRQVTVMFSDLVGSTALADRMDPEDLREIISAYQKCVAETVQRHDGFVARYMGDGVLVHFGYPRAHEDDAERAVRAGLELVTAVAALKPRMQAGGHRQRRRWNRRGRALDRWGRK